jgi:hypothetical protein
VWTYSVGTSLYIIPSLLCEHIVLVQVFVSLQHNRLGVIQRLVPTLYVYTTGLGWYTDLYQHYMFTPQAWGDTRTCTNTICSHNRLGMIHRLVPTLYVHTTGLGWYNDLYQHYMFTIQAWGDTTTCTNTICSHNRLGVMQRLVPTHPKPVLWTYSVGRSLCITPSLLCEHIVLVQVFVSPQACCVNI